MWCHHDYDHVKNVANMVEEVLESLNYDKTLIEDAKIAAILHDIGCIEGKDNHANRSYDMAKKYLKDNSFQLKNGEMVLEAIKIHGDGFDTNNIIALAIIFADKIDIKKQRLAKTGYGVDGVKELQYINEIEVKIKRDSLIVEFISDKKINMEALEAFYFIPKVFKAIYSFANKVKLKPVVLFNGQEWIRQ